MRLQTCRRDRHRCRCLGGKYDLAAQLQTVAVGEFAQTVFIDLGQEGGGTGIDGIRIQDDFFRDGGLVVTDAGNEMQDTQRRLHRGGAPGIQGERRTRKGDGFGKHAAGIKGVIQTRDAGGGIERAFGEMEAAYRFAFEHILRHR